MGQNSQSTQQQQNQTTSPWAPTIPGLTNLVGQINSIGTSLTPQQKAALSGVMSATGEIPNMGAQGTQAANNMFSSTNGIPQAGMWGTAYNNYTAGLSPYMNPNFINPMSAPGMGNALAKMNEDITNQDKSMFAAAGRDPVGNMDYTKAVTTDLARGEGQLLTGEYNTLTGEQLGAMGSAYGAGAGTATGTANLGQIPIQNQIAGLQASEQLPGLYATPAEMQLQAANQGYSAPYSNIQIPLGMMQSTAALGGQSVGSGTSTTTSPVNPFTTALGAGLGIWAMSDERTKENIEPVGLLYNGINVYRYNYKGDARPQIGVMAQEVEQTKPEAVIDVPIAGAWGPSVKMVNYDMATAA